MSTDNDPGARSRARVVSSLDELTPEEKSFLLELGALAKRPEQARDCTNAVRCPLDAARPNWRTTLAAVTKKLGHQGGWKAGLLVDVVPRGLLDDPRAADAEAKLQKSLREEEDANKKQASKPQPGGGQQDTCASLRAAGPVVLAGSQSKCLTRAIPDEKSRQTVELLKVRVSEVTRLDLITIGADVHIRSLDGKELGEHKVSEDQYLFVVPVDSAVTLRAFRGGVRVPVVRTFGAVNRWVEMLPRNALCLLLDLRPSLDPDRAVLVNGQDLGDASSIEIPDERFDSVEPPLVQILDLSSKAKGQYRRLESRSIPWSDLSPDRCFAMQLDVTRRGGIAVIGAEVLPACMAQGVTNTQLRTDAETVLEDLGEKPRKMAEWRNAVTNFGAAISPLQTGRRLGAPVGRLDSTEAILTNAGEFARQGFSALILLELSCRSDSEGTPEYTLHATRLDVVALAEPADAVSGRDVDQDLHPVSESVRGEGELEGLMVRVLSRLQGKPYVWTQPDARIRRLQGSTSERVSLYVPAERAAQAKVKVSLDAYRLSPQDEYVCRGADGAARLSTQRVARAFWDGRSTSRSHHDEALRASPGTESTSVVYWNPYGSGLYLLRFEAHTGNKERPTSFRCVEVKNQNTYFSFDLSYQRSLGLTPARAARNDTVGYGRLLGGLARATGYDGSFNFGLTAGYANAVHSRNTPTAWELTPATTTMTSEPASPPKVPLNWTRQSLLFGPAISVRWSSPLCDLFWRSSCTRPMRSVDLLARALPLVDIGIVNTSSIDPQFRRFLNGNAGLDLDLSFFLEAGIMIHLGQVLSIGLQGSLGVLGWDDFALGGRDQTAAQSSITYDAHVVAGGSMGVTWGY